MDNQIVAALAIVIVLLAMVFLIPLFINQILEKMGTTWTGLITLAIIAAAVGALIVVFKIKLGKG